TFYENTLPVDDANNVNMLVNKTYYLDGSYVPPQLTDLSIQYAATDRQLAQVAADGLADWCNAGRNVGVTFYATSAYRSYESQETLYRNYVGVYGEAQTDLLSARPGFSEHQTGYTVDIAATHEDDIDEFKDTLAYRWTSINSPDYGWILRYPAGKECITGYEFESWHYRYLGVDLARAVYASGMTYDEFYCLYLKPWNGEGENKPKDSILEASDWHTLIAADASETE
ncbi:MAG: M15 family metallopeptidase, partial [Solobacterium sp.]|nr:M15 family metallopeptidase [Solobacterium sp.]